MDNNLEWCPIPNSVLNIHATLANGQCFRWETRADGEWRGVIEDQFVRLVPSQSGFWWQTYPQNGRWDLLHHYFALDIDVHSIYTSWNRAGKTIQESVGRNTGMRILRQSPDEVLFSFLCASNNSILKIRRSVRRLAERAGPVVWKYEDSSYYKFPTPEQILRVPEVELRSDMWGFRAPRLLEIANRFVKQSEWSATNLKSFDYDQLVIKLTELHGIGPKLADCIALFGFAHDSAVPVDTHVRQIGERLLGVVPLTKSLTPSTYNHIASAYRDRFGAYAGWAQQYLFYDSLTSSTISNYAASIRNISK